MWRPRRDSNPCYRRERAVSWATGRRGRKPPGRDPTKPPPTSKIPHHPASIKHHGQRTSIPAPQTRVPHPLRGLTAQRVGYRLRKQTTALLSRRRVPPHTLPHILLHSSPTPSPLPLRPHALLTLYADLDHPPASIAQPTRARSVPGRVRSTRRSPPLHSATPSAPPPRFDPSGSPA